MFYLRNKIGNKLGIVDTKDGICEYYTEEELKSFGVQIQRGISLEQLGNLPNVMNKKLYYFCNREEPSEFINKYCLPNADIILGENRGIKGVYKYCNYNETKGFNIVVFNIDDGKLIYIIDGLGNYNYYELKGANWKLNFYPAGSGRLFNLLFKRCLNKKLNLIEDSLYMLWYNNSDVFILDLGALILKQIAKVDTILK